MRSFASVSPRYWIGSTARNLAHSHPSPEQAPGLRDIQVMGAFVMTAPSHTAIGLYWLPIAMIASTLHMAEANVRYALEALEADGFLRYDWESETIWVVHMAAHQVGLTLSERDKRRPMVERELATCISDTLHNAFVTHYREAYQLGHVELREEKTPLRNLTPSRAPAARAEGEERARASTSPSEKDVIACPMQGSRMPLVHSRSLSLSRSPDPNAREPGEDRAPQTAPALHPPALQRVDPVVSRPEHETEERRQAELSNADWRPLLTELRAHTPPKSPALRPGTRPPPDLVDLLEVHGLEGVLETYRSFAQLCAADPEQAVWWNAGMFAPKRYAEIQRRVALHRLDGDGDGDGDLVAPDPALMQRLERLRECK